MAKVEGPLFSLNATGKIGNAMVHFGWKGLHVVRRFLKPANPKTADQGDTRLVLGGLGKAAAAAELGSPFRTDCIAIAPAEYTWNSNLIKYVIETFMPDATQFEAMYTAYNGHSQKAAFDSVAASVYLAGFDIPYKGTTHSFVAGLQLYMLARFGIAKSNPVTGAFNRAPYTTAISSWDGDDVTALGADLAAS